jgi:hypothetical protein
VKVKLHVFLTLALYECERSASCFGLYTPNTHCIGGWVGTRTNLGMATKRKIHATSRNLILVIYLTATYFTDWVYVFILEPWRNILTERHAAAVAGFIPF